MTGLYAEASRPSTTSASGTGVAPRNISSADRIQIVGGSPSRDIRKKANRSLKQQQRSGRQQQEHQHDEEAQQPNSPQHASLPRVEHTKQPEGGVGSLPTRKNSVSSDHRDTPERTRPSDASHLAVSRRYARRRRNPTPDETQPSSRGASPTTTTLTTPSDFPSLVFGGESSVQDAGSVNTGASSQQELLRKKARSESKKRQNNSRFGGGGGSSSSGKRKSKPKIEIVNMSRGNQHGGGSGAVFSTTTVNDQSETARYRTKTEYRKYESPTKARHNNSNKNHPYNQKWSLNSKTSLDEKESLTAESTVTDSNNSFGNTKQFENLPYSSMPAPPTVVKNEVQIIGANEGWIKIEDERKDDQISIDEYSFPLLSTNALGGVNDSQNKSMSNGNVPQQMHLQRSNSGGRNSVRFSQRLEQSTFFIKDEDSDGNSNPHADSSPLSIMNHPTNCTAKGDGPPKSILRDSKYSKKTQNTVKPIDSRHPAYMQAYLNNANAVLTANHELDQRYHQLSRMDDDSDGSSALPPPPPTPQPSFLDTAGSELSPIRKSSRSMDETFDTQGSESQEPPPHHGYVQQREQHHSDDLVARHETGRVGYVVDNESIASSRMAFIEAVAAVVIQTTYRRHVATQFVRYVKELRAERLAKERAQELGDQQKAGENQVHHQVIVYAAAATLIQAAFRGFWARDCLNVDHYCASAIQKIYRGYVCRMDFQYDMFHIITVQSVWRKVIARMHASYMLAYAIAIQSVARGFLVRQSTRIKQQEQKQEAMLVQANAAAVMIQSLWRMHFCWIRYNELLYALIIQSVVRGWLARQKVSALREAKAASAYKRARRFPAKRPSKQGVPRKTVSTWQRSEGHAHTSPALALQGKTQGERSPKGKKSVFGSSAIKEDQKPQGNVNHFFSQPIAQGKKTSPSVLAVGGQGYPSRWKHIGERQQGASYTDQSVGAKIEKEQTKRRDNRGVDRAPFQESAALSRRLPSVSTQSPSAMFHKVVIAEPFPRDEMEGSLEGSLGNGETESERRASAIYKAMPKKMNSTLSKPVQNVPASGQTERDHSRERIEAKAVYQSRLQQSAAQKRMGKRTSNLVTDSYLSSVHGNRPSDTMRGSKHKASTSLTSVEDLTGYGQNEDCILSTVESSESSLWRKETASVSVRMMNKSGDPYMWAYNVWHEHKLMDWKPA